MPRLLLFVLTTCAALLFTAAGAGAASPVYYSLPTGVNVSQGIAAAPNGDVWLAADGQTSPPTTTIARLRPSAASPGTTNGVATFPTPVPAGGNCCANRVVSVAFDGARNRVWFVQNDGVVGFGAPDSMLPGSPGGMNAIRLAGRQSLYDVAVGANDGAYVTENSADNSVNYYGNRIAFVDGGLVAHEFDNLAQQSPSAALDGQRYDAKPQGITLDATGTPWFAEANPGLPGYRIASGIANGGPRSVGGYAEYVVQPCGPGQPCSGSYTGTGISDVAVAPDGAKWFTNQLKNQVGRFDGTSFTNFDLATIDPGLANGQARAITTAPDGTLWVVEYGGYSYPSANAIIRIDPASAAAPTATVYHLGAGRFPLAVAPDTNGNVWFTTATDNPPALIGELPGVLATAGGPTGGGSTGGGGTGGGATTPGAGTPAAPVMPPALPGPTPVVLKPATRAPARVDPPQVDHASVLADQRCAAYDGAGVCRVVYIISAGEYVNAFPGATIRAVRGSVAKKRPARGRHGVVLARKTVTTKPGTRKRVRITLGAKGRRLLKAHRKLHVYFTAAQAPSGTRPAKVLRRAKLTLKR